MVPNRFKASIRFTNPPTHSYLWDQLGGVRSELLALQVDGELLFTPGGRRNFEQLQALTPQESVVFLLPESPDGAQFLLDHQDDFVRLGVELPEIPAKILQVLEQRKAEERSLNA